MTHHYTFLEDIALADAAFDASGDTPSELFLAAAQALIETLADPHTITPVWTRTVERRDPELASLLFDWLSDIVYLKDAEGVLFHSAAAAVSHDHASGVWTLRGTLTGEPIDQRRHELRADVKAVTKHLYEVKQTGTRWSARVVLDI